MKLVSAVIALFVGVIPVLTFAWGFAEGVARRPSCGSISGAMP